MDKEDVLQHLKQMVEDYENHIIPAQKHKKRMLKRNYVCLILTELG